MEYGETQKMMKVLSGIVAVIAQLGHRLNVAIGKTHFIMDHKYRGLLMDTTFTGFNPEYARCLRIADGKGFELKVTRKVGGTWLSLDGSSSQILGYHYCDVFVYIHNDVTEDLMAQILRELMVSQAKVDTIKKELRKYSTSARQEVLGVGWDVL